MGTYTLTDHLFVVEIPDTNVILGVQWLITLGKVTIDWGTLQMEWTDKKGGKHQVIPETLSRLSWKGFWENRSPFLVLYEHCIIRSIYSYFPASMLLTKIVFYWLQAFCVAATFHVWCFLVLEASLA